MTDTLGIIGTGLIGGSIGKAARARGWHVRGYDPSASELGDAVNEGAIDATAGRAEIYAACRVVAIATPPGATILELQTLAAERPATPDLIFDVASVKEPIADGARNLAQFVPSHPLAGSQRSGVRASSAELFEGCTWTYVPVANPSAVGFFESFSRSLGARPFAIGAPEHDRVVALTSHLPQLLAYCFSQRVRVRAENEAPEHALLRGPVARELLRLGDSPPALWEEIFALNGANVVRELDALVDALQSSAARIAQPPARLL